MGVTWFPWPQVHPWNCLAQGGEVPLLGTGRDRVGGSIYCGNPGRCGMENLEGGGTLLKCSDHSIGVQGLALVDSKELWLALGLADSP